MFLSDTASVGSDHIRTAKSINGIKGKNATRQGIKEKKISRKAPSCPGQYRKCSKGIIINKRESAPPIHVIRGEASVQVTFKCRFSSVQ